MSSSGTCCQAVSSTFTRIGSGVEVVLKTPSHELEGAGSVTKFANDLFNLLQRGGVISGFTTLGVTLSSFLELADFYEVGGKIRAVFDSTLSNLGRITALFGSIFQICVAIRFFERMSLINLSHITNFIGKIPVIGLLPLEALEGIYVGFDLLDNCIGNRSN